jgi:predicted enzyme related to lactoylglutathione lyase
LFRQACPARRFTTDPLTAATSPSSFPFSDMLSHMSLVKMAAACVLAATIMMAQESGIHVRAVRVLAADPDALATFYEKAFGMSEIGRPANSATSKEIRINAGSTVEIAKTATTAPVVIMTRPKDTPVGFMATLILQVPDVDKAIATVKANGGTLMRPANKSAEGNSFAFVKDPDGNQIELVMSPK